MADPRSTRLVTHLSDARALALADALMEGHAMSKAEDAQRTHVVAIVRPR